jgi:2-polyprenyl-3-methyl-5-hydroxy-6-metoxy-1,4-benzoquinol methylase
LDDLGAIPSATVFAGQSLDPPWDGGSLYRCRHCHLVFRHPIRSDDEYERLYEQAPKDVWVSAELRTDQRLVRARIESARTEPGSVLDVGCYDGTLLASLPPRFRRCGIEASALAAETARHKGIEIVGTSIRDLASMTEQFDAISAVDVIEHVSDPRAFIAMLASRLSAGGILLISTGSTDTPAWRFAGGRYWYCAFPEHISFISPAWARSAAAQLHLEVIDAQPFAYADLEPGSRRRARRRYYRKLMQEKIRQAVATWLPGSHQSRVTMRSHGQPGLFEDHTLITFRHHGPPRSAVRGPG